MGLVLNNFSEYIGEFEITADAGNERFTAAIDEIDFGGHTESDWKYRWSKTLILCDIFSQGDINKWAGMRAVIPTLLLGINKASALTSSFMEQGETDEWNKYFGEVKNTTDAWVALGVEVTNEAISENLKRNIPRIERFREIFTYIGDVKYEYIDTDSGLSYEFGDGVHDIVDEENTGN